MAWKKSKSHHARKAQATEIMQENHFACYFTHTVYMSECQTQMSWVINHWFIKDLACLHTTMKWHIMTCDRFGLLKNTDKKKNKTEQKNNTETESWSFLSLYFMILIHLTSVLTLMEIKESLWKVFDLWRDIWWKKQLYHKSS